MYENFYNIAGLNIRVLSDFVPADDDYSALFRLSEAPDKTDITCRVKTIDAPCENSARLLTQNEDIRLFREGDTVRIDLMFHGGDRILAQSEYNVAGGEINVTVIGSEMPYIARTTHIWTTMDICFALLTHGRLVLHSSSILVNGKVILFAAPSGTGKSTQAALWEKYRCAEVLNGDKNCVSFDENSGTALAHGLPFCGTSGICRQYSLPLGAIVLLKQAPENKIRRLRGITALSALSANCMGHKSVPETMLLMSDVLQKVLRDVPVFELSCTPDERAVELLEKTLTR